jgi:hypothetical protein
MAGCGKTVDYTVPTRYSSKIVAYQCGATGIGGYPVFCPECEKKYAGRDWRREAIEAGENFDEEY